MLRSIECRMDSKVLENGFLGWSSGAKPPAVLGRLHAHGIEGERDGGQRQEQEKEKKTVPLLRPCRRCPRRRQPSSVAGAVAQGQLQPSCLVPGVFSRDDDAGERNACSKHIICGHDGQSTHRELHLDICKGY